MRVFGYKGEHSITFVKKDYTYGSIVGKAVVGHSYLGVFKYYRDVKNTWTDLHLVPNSRPLVNPPKAKTEYIDIPGSNGKLDLTTALTGYVSYENREGSWDFTVAQENYGEWYKRYSELLSWLNGEELEISLYDEPYFFYKGRFDLEKWESGQGASAVTIFYSLYPYKLEPLPSDEPWVWDPFDFEYGVIREFAYMNVNISTFIGGYTVILPKSEEPQIPVINVVLSGSQAMTMTDNNTGKKYMLVNGDNEFSDIIVDAIHEKRLIFSGNGYLRHISMRGGWF